MRSEIGGLAATIRRCGAKPMLALAAAGALVLGAGAGPALANSYTLHLSAPATAVVGQPFLIQATGVNPPPDQYWAAAWIEVVSIPTTVMTTCPAGDQDGLSVATGTGGAVLALSLRPNLDAAGNFSNVIGATASKPGSVLICGYEDDGAGLTLARDSLTIDLLPASTPSPTGTAKPVSLEKPHLVRSGRVLTCNRGRWSNRVTSYAFGWLVDGKPKKRATRRELTITRTLRGHNVRCAVTASNAAGRTTALSRPLRIR